MNISDICRRGIVCVDRHASPREAAMAMRKHHVGTVVVTDAVAGAPHAVGILTDRDLTLDVLGGDDNIARGPVDRIASAQLVAVAGSAGIDEAVCEMQRHGVRRLLVTGAEREVIGIVSADDLLEAVALQLAGLSAALREGITREASEPPVDATAKARPVFLPYGTPGLQRPAWSAAEPRPRT